MISVLALYIIFGSLHPKHVSRYYFQLLADEVGMARGFLGIIRRFGWKRVGIITQNENLFTVVSHRQPLITMPKTNIFMC